jgi:hypothetical protein
MDPLARIALDAATPWRADLPSWPGAEVWVRALTPADVIEAEAATCTAIDPVTGEPFGPPSLYGRVLYEQIAREVVAAVAQAAAAVHSATEALTADPTEEHARAVSTAHRALYVASTQTRARLMWELAEANASGGRAVDAFHRRTQEEVRQLAARVLHRVPAWEAPAGPFRAFVAGDADAALQAMLHLADDDGQPSPDRGAIFAAEVLSAVKGRELGPEGKAGSGSPPGRPRATARGDASTSPAPAVPPGTAPAASPPQA